MSMSYFARALLVILTSSLPVAGAAEDADPQKGEALWRRCSACHEVGPGARNKVGPHLNDLFGRVAGSVADYTYSKAMIDAGADGLAWQDDTLSAFLERPKSFVPKTRMTFPGFRDAQDRADLIAFLRPFSGAQSDAGRDAHLRINDPELPAGVLAIQGDREWGEYLAQTCVTCHQISGADKGIPSITGWPKEAFLTAMFSYRDRFRENPVMQQIAGSLNNEEIAALAAYFSDLEPAD
jgi:cytochrome c